MVLFVFFLFSLYSSAVDDVLRYRVMFSDKGKTVAERDTVPALSERALARRVAFGVGTDSTDFPICTSYINSIRDSGFLVVSGSRWMNSIVVSVSDTSRNAILKSFPFVRSVCLVWVNPSRSARSPRKIEQKFRKFQIDSTNYFGKATTQNTMLGLEPLHKAGFRGNGLLIAVVDAGFLNADSMSWFSELKLISTKDFIYPATSIYKGHYHGTAVLSIMAAKADYTFTGVAPEAEYCLLRSEDVNSEFPIEEDYWAAAVEYADSIGADIVTSSLGYTQFDSTFMSYSQKQLDGNTAYVSKAAGIAVKKGLLLVCSAGNDGQSSWRKISFPGDVSGVLTVGSVNSSNIRSSFSSVGPTADGRIKPDVMAMGERTTVVNGKGVLSNDNSGTSWSAPLITGMAACLWQAFPNLSASELIQNIENSADRALTPDTLYGYGTPNAYKIWLSLQEYPVRKEIPDWYCFPNPADDKLYIANFSGVGGKIKCFVFDLSGTRVIDASFSGQYHILDVSRLPASVYFVNLYKNGKLMSSNKIQIKHP